MLAFMEGRLVPAGRRTRSNPNRSHSFYVICRARSAAKRVAVSIAWHAANMVVRDGRQRQVSANESAKRKRLSKHSFRKSTWGREGLASAKPHFAPCTSIAATRHANDSRAPVIALHVKPMRGAVRTAPMSWLEPANDTEVLAGEHG